MASFRSPRGHLPGDAQNKRNTRSDPADRAEAAGKLFSFLQGANAKQDAKDARGSAPEKGGGGWFS